MTGVVGFVDGLEGSVVRGWAMSPSSHPAYIVVCDSGGRPLAQGRAQEQRPDLGRLAQGRTACGFHVALPDGQSTSALRVLADGVELAGSPIELGLGRYDGALSVVGGVASGWVAERIKHCRGIRVQLRDQDGAVVGEVDAVEEPREPGLLHAPARFSAELPSRCFGRPDLLLRAVVGGVQVAETRCSMRLDGHLDAIGPTSCQGWLLSRDVPKRALEIEVFRDGEPVGRGICDRPRGDVRSGYPNFLRVGFDIALRPPSSAAGASATYSLRLSGTSIELFDGPLVLEDRLGAIAAARRLARRAVERGVPAAELAVLQRALVEFIDRCRTVQDAEPAHLVHASDTDAAPMMDGRRLAIVVSIYRGVEATRVCLESVLATRDPDRDTVILVNDCSPDPGMDALLEVFARQPEVFLLTNAENLGFIRSANRGIAACRSGDVLLLNSDTRVFPGVIDELYHIAHAAPDIGTVTAMSNNASIFSYPHPSLPKRSLSDQSWAEVAVTARAANGGYAVDVPTGHGFCLLIPRNILQLVGALDEAFGRGYGEENDLCQRIADLGFRNVAATGAFVEHSESVSFGEEKPALVAANLGKLGKRYPEYHATIMEFERREGLRRARWPIDAARLRKASAEGGSFALVVTNRMGGGAARALTEIESALGSELGPTLVLTCRADGMIEVDAKLPLLRAAFTFDEIEPLFALLSAARIARVLIHQVLGFPADFLTELAVWARGRNAIFYAQDFYPICQRVTMIDAAGGFCDIAAADICSRCIAAGGQHEASRLHALSPEQHRAAFGALLRAVRHVVAPSVSAASYLLRVWPDLPVTVTPHAEPVAAKRGPPRSALSKEIVLLGGLGPRKGSATLLAIARQARLSHPDLRFRVIGHTDIDAQLRAVGNVWISGRYERSELPGLLLQAEGRIALFLHNWPQPYSYTLSEAVTHGFLPLVPDIGAPAERVRRAGIGKVFGFPIEPAEVLRTIDAALAEPPSGFAATQPFLAADAAARHRQVVMPDAEPAIGRPAAASITRRARRRRGGTPARGGVSPASADRIR